MTWIQLYDGTPFDFDSDSTDGITIENIAEGLSKINRFSGHTLYPISVAQHSEHVSMLVPAELALPALLHDAHECLDGFGDISAPRKEAMPPHVAEWYNLQVRWINCRIAKAFGFDVALFDRPEIKRADGMALVAEALFAMNRCKREWPAVEEARADVFVGNVDYDYAKAAFLTRYRRIVNARASTNGERRAD